MAGADEPIDVIFSLRIQWNPGVYPDEGEMVLSRERTVPWWLPASAYAVVADFHFSIADQDGCCPVTAGELLNLRPFVLMETHVDLGVIHTFFVQLLLKHVGEIALGMRVQNRNFYVWCSQLLIAVLGFRVEGLA